MDPEIDSAAFMLHGIHLAVCISAFMLNLLLLYLLRRFSVFHHHMRIIMINLTLSVNAAVFYLGIRSTIGMQQIWYKNSDDNVKPSEPTDSSNCVFSESVPPTVCFNFLIFPLVLVTERCYATQSYRRYENQNIESLYRWFCSLMWIPTGYSLLSFLFDISFPPSLPFCQLSALNKSFLQRNIWFIIVATFSMIFAMLFKCLEWQNRAYEKDCLEKNYTTISIRFQIRENIRTCRFAVSLNSLFFISFLIFFLLDQNIGSDMDDSASRREYLFMIFPVFATIYAVHCINSHPQLYEKAKLVLRRWTPGHMEQQKMLQS